MGRKARLTVTLTVFTLSSLLLLWAGWQWWSPVDSSASGNRPAPAVSPREVLTFSLPTAGYTSQVRTMDIADSGVIDPPDYEHTWWIRDRGVAPGSAATDTTYLACHTHSGKSAHAVPCNMVSPENVPVGAEVQVTTDVEELTYEIIEARTIPRDEFEHDPEIWDVHPGRLVWISCYLEDGRYSDYNFVVIAELT